MTEIVPVPEGDRERMAAITEYLNHELAQQSAAAPAVHVHYHAAPVAPATVPAAQSRGEVALINATPYFIILLGGVVILACVGVVTVLLLPALLAMVVMVGEVMAGFAICVVAIAASVRSLRQSRTERQVSASLLKNRRRRR